MTDHQMNLSTGDLLRLSNALKRYTAAKPNSYNQKLLARINAALQAKMTNENVGWECICSISDAANDKTIRIYHA